MGWNNRNFSTFRKYTVKESEVDTFINFINIVEQKLNFDKEKKKFRSFHISIDRYNSALLESIDIDRKLMTAVMGLESLFTFEKDRGENAFKLGVRVAKLLGHLNFDAEKVRELTEMAYNFRNKVVHGSYISQEDKKKMNEIFPDCFRRSKFDPLRRSDFDPLFKASILIAYKVHVTLHSAEALSVHVQNHCMMCDPV